MFARPGGPGHPVNMQQQPNVARQLPPRQQRPMPPPGSQPPQFLQNQPSYASPAPQMEYGRPGGPISGPQYVSGIPQSYPLDPNVPHSMPPAQAVRNYAAPTGPFNQPPPPSSQPPRPLPPQLPSHQQQASYLNQNPPARQFTPQNHHPMEQPPNGSGPPPRAVGAQVGGGGTMDSVVGNGMRNGSMGMPEAGPSGESAMRQQTRFPGATTSDAHARQQLHSYIYDYLRREGMHTSAHSFLQDAPDTPVRVHPGQIHPAKGKGRAFDEKRLNSDGEISSPANRPDTNAADSIGSTNSSTSHFGFNTLANNDSPANSPEFDFKSLPAPLTEVESEVSLLWEWWIVFWDVFNARSGGGSANARVYVEAANQASALQGRRRVPGPEVRMQPNPMMNGSPQRPPYPPQQNPAFGSPQRAPLPNGVNVMQRPGQPMPPPGAPGGPPAQGQPNGRQIQFSDRPPMMVQNGAPPGTMQGQAPPPAAGVARQVTAHRRGALSPAPLSDPLLRQRQQDHAQQQAQLQANHQLQQNHQIHIQQQRRLQEQAAQAAALAAQQQHHNQQLQFNPTYSAQVTAAQQALQVNAMNQQRAQQVAQNQQQAMQNQQQAMQNQQRPPSAMAGSPQVHHRIPSNHGSPYAMGTPQDNYPPSPAKRFMIPNGEQNGGTYVVGTPQNYSSPGQQAQQTGFSPQGQNADAFHAYRAQMAAQHMAGVQGSSPRPEVTTPYSNGVPPPRPLSSANFHVQQQPGQSPHPNAPYNGQEFQAFVQEHSRPSSAAGNIRVDGPPGSSEGSMGPPSSQPTRRTLSQIGAGGSNAPTPQAPTPGDSPSLQPPTPQGSGPAATTTGKRKRETKETQAKKRTAKGRDRSESVTSVAQGPTPTPAADGTPVASGLPEFTNSPASMLPNGDGQPSTNGEEAAEQQAASSVQPQGEPQFQHPPPPSQDLGGFDLSLGDSHGHLDNPYQMFDAPYDFSQLAQVEMDGNDTSFDFDAFLDFPAEETNGLSGNYDTFESLQV